MLLRNLNSVLVARDPAVAKCGEVATVVDSALPFYWNDGKRRVIGVSCLLRSGSVPLVCIRFPALRNFAA
jgi:hypothetical protein